MSIKNQIKIINNIKDINNDLIQNFTIIKRQKLKNIDNSGSNNDCSILSLQNWSKYMNNGYFDKMNII